MKKQLLKESEIRKMMKFANIGALSNGFVEKIHENYEMEEDLNEEEDALEDEEALDTDMADDETDMPDMPEPMDDMAPAGEPEEGGDILGLVKGAMENFIQALEMAGPEGQEAAANLSVQSDAAGGEEADEIGAADDDMGDMGDDMGMADAGGEMGDEEPALAEMVDEEKIMNEVARRVARRLRKRG